MKHRTILSCVVVDGSGPYWCLVKLPDDEFNDIITQVVQAHRGLMQLMIVSTAAGSHDVNMSWTGRCALLASSGPILQRCAGEFIGLRDRDAVANAWQRMTITMAAYITPLR